MDDVLIIGAGMAGLAAAQILAQHGIKVRLLEKSRGLGGRMATRRITTSQGEVWVDHGAQYFTCRSPEFQTFLAPLIAQGQVMPWLTQIPTLTAAGIIPAPLVHHEPRYACPAGMTTWCGHLSRPRRSWATVWLGRTPS